MDIRELRYFEQVAKDKSFTRAANNLFLSQPALSRTIQKLEQELGVELLTKCGGTIKLTDCGAALLEHARPVINQFDQLTNLVSDVKNLKSGVVRIGVSAILGSLYISKIIIDFGLRYPDMELKVYERPTNEVCEKLQRGDVDIGLCLRSASAEMFQCHELIRDELVVLCHRSNPIAQLERVHFEQLHKEDFNIFHSGAQTNKDIFRRCQEAGFTPRITLSCYGSHYSIKMTNAGKGICILPRPYALQYESPNLAVVPLAPSLPWVCCILTRRNDYLPFGARMFYQDVVDFFDELNRKKNPDSSPMS